MGWPGVELTERQQFKAGDTRVFWGREHRWTGSKWEPVDGRKKEEPTAGRAKAKAVEPAQEPTQAKAKEPEPAKDGESEEATILDKWKLKITGPGHKQLAKAVERGISKAADLCQINPPICKGNLGRPRKTMPQFPDDKVRDSFLEAMRKKGIRVTEGKVKVGHLKASQDELQAKKVIGMAGAYLNGDFSKIKNAIVISKDGYIVDGHHRWAALLLVNPGEEMNVIRVGVPIKPLLDLVNGHEGVTQRGLEAASIGREKKEDAWYARAASLFERAAGGDASAGPELRRMVEYGSPVVAEPRRAMHFSPKGGYRVPQTDRMADARKRRKRSGREQPFIDPEDFRHTEGARSRFVSIAEIVSPMPRGGRTGRLAYAAVPVGAGHGVGRSPSAAPADREEGRFRFVVDGPRVRKTPTGFKPTRAGAGSMVPTVAKRS